ncbi:MAG TPA: 50S ribosomal protein L15 [Cyclobacteriaceae bacterium]
MKLHTLKPAEGSTKKPKRIGRGQGSGRGGTSTRGHKGAKSRSGYSQKAGFEGGQMPLQRRVPKFGFKSLNKIYYKPINLSLLQKLADDYQMDSLNVSFFIQHGLISKSDKVKILGDGELNRKVDVEAHAYSKKAKEVIESIGGQAVTI